MVSKKKKNGSQILSLYERMVIYEEVGEIEEQVLVVALVLVERFLKTSTSLNGHLVHLKRILGVSIFIA